MGNCISQKSSTQKKQLEKPLPIKKEGLDGVNASNFVGLNPGNFKDHYKREKKLGDGAFGVVYRCASVATGEKFAVKTITKSKVSKKA